MLGGNLGSLLYGDVSVMSKSRDQGVARYIAVITIELPDGRYSIAILIFSGP